MDGWNRYKIADVLSLFILFAICLLYGPLCKCAIIREKGPLVIAIKLFLEFS